MGRHEIGDRVGAVSHSDGKVTYLFGYGTYDGDVVPPPGVQAMGIELHELGVANPKITLDSGKVVWGCECWWGTEAAVRKRLSGFDIVAVDIDESRANAARASEQKCEQGS